MPKRSGKIQTREHLIIPDSHAKPGVNNDRFKWAGEFALERQPDVIIDIGDSADMASLCQYDVGKLRAEGRRYSDDIRAYRDAMDKFIRPINKYNNTHSKWKKKTYRPTLIKCRGNHEYRIARAASESPALYGHVDYSDLQEEKHGWQVKDFLEAAVVDGIAYQHFFTSGVMGRPIGGVNHARTLVAKNHMSSVCGHSHMRDFWEDIKPDGQRVFGLSVGCYFEHDEEYTTENDRFWRGLVYLRDVFDGQAEPEFVSLARIKASYS